MLIQLSSYSQAHDKVLAWDAEFDHYFVKPIDRDALQNLMGRLG